MQKVKVTFLPTYSGSYFRSHPYSQGVATAGSSARLIWRSFTPDAPLDATPEGFVSPPGFKRGIFSLLGECVNQHTIHLRSFDALAHYQ